MQELKHRTGIVAALTFLVYAGPIIAANSTVPTNFPTIQAAINDVGTMGGDTITVLGPSHTETGVTVNKAVTIQGQGLASTTIDATGGNAFLIITDNVTIQDMTIDSAGQAVRIELAGMTVDSTTVQRVRMENFTSRGVEIHNATTATNLLIDSCEFDGTNGSGIRVASSGAVSNIDVLNSLFEGANGLPIGFYVANEGSTSTARDVTITGNTFQNIATGQGTAVFVEELQDALISMNTFTDNRRDVQIFKWYQAAEEVSNVTISDNTISGTTNAVFAIFNAEHSSGRTTFNGVEFSHNTATGIAAAVFAGAHDDALGLGGDGWDTVVIGCNDFTGTIPAGSGVRFFNPGVPAGQELAGASIDVIQNWWGSTDSMTVEALMEDPSITDFTPFLNMPQTMACTVPVELQLFEVE